MVLKVVGLVVLVALILVGALLPLKYTARMHLPRRPPAQGEAGDEPGHGQDGTGSSRPRKRDLPRG